MAIPKDALRLANSHADMDPADQRPFEFDARPFLAAGETVAALTATLADDAISAGVTLGTGSRAAGPAAIDDVANAGGTFWLSVADAHRADAAFVTGLQAAVQIDFTTSSNPSSHIKRTCVVLIRGS